VRLLRLLGSPVGPLPPPPGMRVSFSFGALYEDKRKKPPPLSFLISIWNLQAFLSAPPFFFFCVFPPVRFFLHTEIRRARLPSFSLFFPLYQKRRSGRFFSFPFFFFPLFRSKKHSPYRRFALFFFSFPLWWKFSIKPSFPFATPAELRLLPLSPSFPPPSLHKT